MAILKNILDAKYTLGSYSFMIILFELLLRFGNSTNTFLYFYLFIILSRFKHILQPIAGACISREHRKQVDFESFFTHTICHECCHGIGPHTITLPNGRTSTVRKELQELHSPLEEAKADIVGLWALKFLIAE
ncbi:hypothetical protein CRG98_033225, partial [Punica granatum]